MATNTEEWSATLPSKVNGIEVTSFGIVVGTKSAELYQSLFSKDIKEFTKLIIPEI